MNLPWIYATLLVVINLDLALSETWCNGSYTLIASRTSYSSTTSPEYHSSSTDNLPYSCTFTVNAETSSDTVLIQIDNVDSSISGNSMSLELADGTLEIRNSDKNSLYSRQSYLRFFFNGESTFRSGGFSVLYWAEPTDFSGSETFAAYYNTNMSFTRSYSYSKVSTPVLYTKGIFTYTVVPASGHGDQVVVYVNNRNFGNIDYMTINTVAITGSNYTRFHQDSTVTIRVYWNNITPAWFTITIYYFSTFTVNYVSACSSTQSLPSSQTNVAFVYSPHFPATYYKVNTNYDCTYRIDADTTANLVGLLVQYSYLEVHDNLYVYNGNVGCVYTNYDCTYRIDADTTANLVGLLVQYSYLEVHDNLYVYNGNVGGTVLFHSTGSTSGFVLSTTSYVYIKFTTDDSTTTSINDIPISASFNGFLIRYLTVAGNTLSQPAFTSYTPDEYTFLVTDETDTSALHPPFSSTYNTYMNTVLYWMIRAPCKSYANEIQVLFLDLDGGNDRLTIYNGYNASYGTLLDYNYQRNAYGNNTYTVTSSGQYSLVRFSIDGSNNDAYGWLLTYKIVQWSTPGWYSITNVTFPPSTTVDSVCDKAGRTLIGYCPWTYRTISSPGFPSVYAHNLDCEWIIEAEDRYYINEIDFLYFDMENQTYCVYDYLRVYDGAYALDKDLLNTFCGPNLPPSQKSSTQWMRLKFHSDYSLQYSGFQFTYKSVNITQEQCYKAYDSYQALNATASAQFFTSQNYPSYYPNNHDKYWMITNPQYPTAKLVLKITNINIEVAEYCKYDRIMIYEGKCATSRVIYTYCSKRPKLYELSTSMYYLIRHHTDYNIVKEGFQMKYYYTTSVAAGTTTTTTTTAGPPVSRVAQLMNELTNSTFYNNENVPMKDLNYASPAKISFELTSIIDLNEKYGRLSSVGKFTLQWLDELLVWEPAKKYNITYFYIPQDEVWKPSIALVNAYTGVQKMGASFMYVHVTYNGTTTWKPKRVLQSNCKVDLTYYPYDEQVCQLKFQLWAMENTNINFTVSPQGFYLSSEYRENSRWRMINSGYSEESLPDRNLFTFTVRLKRNSGFPLYYLMFPVITLASLNAFVFVLPPESEEKGRLSILIFCGFLLNSVIQNKEMPKHSTGLSLMAIYSTILLVNSFFICLLSLMVLRTSHFRDTLSPPGSGLCKFARMISGLRAVLTCFCVRYKNPSQKVTWKHVASAAEFVLFWSFAIYYVTITAYFYMRIAG